jgi:hypothetical protein
LLFKGKILKRYKMLKQKENRVKIEGILAEIDINPSTFKKNGVDTDAIGGSIIVKVIQKINNVEKELMIPVHMFSAKYTNAGKPNPAFESIAKVRNEFKSIASTGDESLADRVRITNGQIRMNEYYSADGRLVSFPRINASFVNKITTGEFKPEATFALEFAVANAGDEMDKNGEPTGRYNVTALVPQYGEKVDVVPLFAENEKVISAISTYWTIGDTFKANGRLDFSSTTEVTYEEVDFGEPVEKIRTINKSDLIITGGSQVPYEGDFALAKEDLDAALARRKVALEEQKAKDMSRVAKKQTPSATTSKGYADLGF